MVKRKIKDILAWAAICAVLAVMAAVMFIIGTVVGLLTGGVSCVSAARSEIKRRVYLRIHELNTRDGNA